MDNILTPEEKNRIFASIKNGGLTSNEKVALRVAKNQNDETIQGAACIVLAEAICRLLVERGDTLAQLSAVQAERDAAVADIESLLKSCDCETRHDYCMRWHESDGCDSDDCQDAKWRGVPAPSGAEGEAK